MNKYLVVWAIEVDADSPKQAAIAARKHQVAKGTLAKVFDIYDEDTLEPIETVDLIPKYHMKHAEYDKPKPIYLKPTINETKT